MGWAVGGPDDHGRWYGYGVPATCDHPECDQSIDRGLDYACGDGVMGDYPNCGLHFCAEHMTYRGDESPDDDNAAYCERCAAGNDPFEPKPETAEWLTHLLTDESWRKWRTDSPRAVDEIRAALAADHPAAAAGTDETDVRA